VKPSTRANGLGDAERRLVPALYFTFLVLVGVLIFGLTRKPDIHQTVSVIDICITSIGSFLIIQGTSLYLPLSYPRYAASALAAGSVHFNYPMFHHLGVDRGITLLAGLIPDAALDKGVKLNHLSLFEDAHAPGNSTMRSSQ
jgi:DHA1 family multidrug resistance protein-like MFS transporter